MMRDPIEQFRDAIAAAGITPPGTIEPDGELHRFSSNGKRGDDAGWYSLHLDGVAAGIFGCWRTGIKQTWRADADRKQTDEEARQWRAQIEAMHKQRKAEEGRNHEQAATRAAAMWEAAQPAPEDHPYLTRKGIKPHGVKVGGEWLAAGSDARHGGQAVEP